MADALVSAVVEGLRAIAKDKVGLLVGVEKEVKNLLETFTAIQAVLEDAERQQVKKTAVQDWLLKLKEVAYEMEDILDEWRTEAFRSQNASSYLFNLGPVFKKIKLHHDTGHKIWEIKERLMRISMEKDAFNFNEVSKREVDDLPDRQTASLIIEAEVFGRDAIKDIIVNELVGDTSQAENPFSVVSLVGMGGLGKTTLAQLVYNDETVKKHFEKRIWVCVSEDYEVKKILIKVIQSMDKSRSTDENMDFDTLQTSVKEVVAKNKFLLVLDDVWDGKLWEKLRVPLKGAVQGCRIVVTTRSQTIACVMETTHNHELGILPDLDCWKLFTSKAFRGRKEEEWPLQLVEVGKGILHRCKGLPLAIKAVGSLLYFKRTKLEWQVVLESETWEWNSPDGLNILPALLLSYYALPIHLKQCLLFCSLFPKDYVLEKDELVKLWMAHGIIKSERREIEEIGETYFEDLLARSLLQDPEKDVEGNITHCKMHDLVHDLAKFVTTGDYCIMEIGNPNLPSVDSHHISLLVNHDVSHIPSPLCNAERLRTLIFFGESIIEEVPHSLFNHMRFLRALDLSKTMIENLPSSLGELKHLRYLNLNGLNIEELPESLTDLCNLQTLKLNKCDSLRILPSGTSKMVNLRHLEIEGADELTFLPNGLGRLSSLRTLHKFPVGGDNRGCKIGELKNLNLLRGEIEIKNLERVINVDEAREAELDKKCHLQRLTLECNYKEDEEWETLGEGAMKRMERVFDGLRPPHSNLKFLSIENYAGSEFPSWLEDASFSSLHTVKLFNCKKCRLLPGLGKLPSLESVSICGADEIKVVGCDFYYGNNGNDGRGKGGRVFPKLKSICFFSMSNWEEWKWAEEDGEVMPSLEKLEIRFCNKLKALPNCLPSTLRQVIIKNCKEITWAPDNPLPLLEELILYGDVGGIFGKPLPCLPALKKLRISSTPLESLPSDGWGLLESLNTLEISYCDRLASLPNGLGQLKALQVLRIVVCKELSSLFDGFEQLKSLRRLDISYCRKLTPLPNLQHLTALECLAIDYCPLVTERLDKEKGEDWCNISHIPYIRIDLKMIQ